MLTTTLKAPPRLLKLEVTTAPTTEPVTVPELRRHLQLTHKSEDWELEAFIRAARVAVEEATGRSLLSQVVTAYYAFGSEDAFPLYRPPVVSLTSVATLYEGTETAETASKFWVDSSGPVPVLRMKSASAWGETNRDTLKVVYAAGYGATRPDVPHLLREAVRMTAADMYFYRTSREEKVGAEVPQSAFERLAPYRIITF